MKKLSKLPVPARLVVKSFEVVIILVLYVKNTRTCRFPNKLYFKPAMIWNFDAHLKSITNKFQVSIYLV